MTQKVASGSIEFELKRVHEPEAPVEAMAVSKTFDGDLDGTSSGQVLAVHGPEEGSAGYVAMERVTATLAGVSGTFALQHIGSRDKGVPTMSVNVVPGSGTGGFVGLKGSMEVSIENDKHLYAFRYSLL
jgi:hypothetical protein